MRYSSYLAAGIALALGFCLGLTGCGRAPAELPQAPPPPVTVSYPVEREVTDYADFTARTAAVDSVELRARVSGYLDKVNFKEGAAGQEGGRALRDRPAHLPGGPAERRGQPRGRRGPGQAVGCGPWAGAEA